MNKRLFAWILLIGFVILVVNIFFIGYQRALFLVIYLIIAVYYLISINKKK